MLPRKPGLLGRGCGRRGFGVADGQTEGVGGPIGVGGGRGRGGGVEFFEESFGEVVVAAGIENEGNARHGEGGAVEDHGIALFLGHGLHDATNFGGEVGDVLDHFVAALEIGAGVEIGDDFALNLEVEFDVFGQ